MTWSPEVYKRTWNFATLAHQGQTYGGPEKGMQIDYLNHIGSVAVEVIWGFSAVPDCNANFALQCALLHDVIEDTETSYDDILAQFGNSVADGVLALTKNSDLPTKQVQMEDSLARIRQQPREIWMVKMADRITNLYHPPFYWDNDKMKAYRQEARTIYEALHLANDMLAKRLFNKIETYDRFLK